MPRGDAIRVYFQEYDAFTLSAEMRYNSVRFQQPFSLFRTLVEPQCFKLQGGQLWQHTANQDATPQYPKKPNQRSDAAVGK